jgi:hypothetical protein
MRDGYIAYFANFMFNQLPGEYETRLTIMEKEVQRFHGILTRHVVRKPESKAWKPLCPSLIGCPDAPVRKLREKAQRAMGSVANDGWHYNGIILVPPRRRDTGGKTVRDAGGRASRLEVGLIMHVASMERQYLNRRLQRIHVTRCRSAEMVDYVFKTFKAGRVSLDRILVL